MSEAKYTPGPWEVWDASPYEYLRVGVWDDGKFSHVADVIDRQNGEANAEFICRAVNAHEALVAALKLVDGWAQQHDSMPDALSLQIRTALTKAGVL